MSNIQSVKKLREVTGAGFKDCNLAIKESEGDIDKAIEILRVKGISKASKKMSRDAKEGVVVVSGDDSKTSVIENVLNTYNDNDDFYLIFSESQRKKYKKEILNLKKFKKKINISFIKDHNKGPVYSIISANFKFYDSKIIIAYNDFIVNWDYKKFLRNRF